MTTMMERRKDHEPVEWRGGGNIRVRVRRLGFVGSGDMGQLAAVFKPSPTFGQALVAKSRSRPKANSPEQ